MTTTTTPETQNLSVEEQLGQLIPDRTFLISTNGTGQGKLLYDEAPGGDSIYAQTIRVNARTVQVERLYDLKDEFGPDWAWRLWRLAVEREEVKVRSEILNFESRTDPRTGMREYQFPSGNWRTEQDVWDIQHDWAIKRLRKRGYAVPASIER